MSVTRVSPIMTSPSVTSSRPATIRSSVVLPQPDGPTSTRNSPSPTSIDTSSTATTPPLNTFVTPSITILAMAPLPSLESHPRRGQLFAHPRRRAVARARVIEAQQCRADHGRPVQHCNAGLRRHGPDAGADALNERRILGAEHVAAERDVDLGAQQPQPA